MAIRPRKGATVYASQDITQDDIFPGVSSIYNVSIPRGTKGKVTSTAEEGLLLVDFGKKKGEWYIEPKLLQRTKVK